MRFVQNYFCWRVYAAFFTNILFFPFVYRMPDLHKQQMIRETSLSVNITCKNFVLSWKTRTWLITVTFRLFEVMLLQASFSVIFHELPNSDFDFDKDQVKFEWTNTILMKIYFVKYFWIIKCCLKNKKSWFWRNLSCENCSHNWQERNPLLT